MKRQVLSAAAGLWSAAPAAVRRSFLHATNDRFLVGVVGLIHDAEARVLLLEHRFRTPWPWGLPGGFIDHGESLPSALARELFEELGAEVEIEQRPFDTELNVEGRYVAVALCARPRAELLVPTGTEITGGRFFAAPELPAGIYPHHAALVERFWRERGLLGEGAGALRNQGDRP